MADLLCEKCHVLYDESETVARKERDFEIWCITCDEESIYASL